jgi:hypothetical protein
MIETSVSYPRHLDGVGRNGVACADRCTGNAAITLSVTTHLAEGDGTALIEQNVNQRHTKDITSQQPV